MEKIKIATHLELAKIPHVKHGFFTRLGGVSEGVYASLNVGYNTGDEVENIRHNRELVVQSLGLKNYQLLTLEQIHSNKVITVANQSDLWTEDNRPEADAVVTNLTGIILGIQTADCVPIIFVDTKKEVIGIAHAGWRGALTGIIENTIVSMQKLESRTKDIRAVIGPCIHQKFYEVDKSFYQNFLEESGNNQQFFTPATNAEHFMFDLPGCVRSKLIAAGLERVYDINLDTYTNEAEFFSYRRSSLKGEKDCGRQISTVVLV